MHDIGLKIELNSQAADQALERLKARIRDLAVIPQSRDSFGASIDIGVEKLNKIFVEQAAIRSQAKKAFDENNTALLGDLATKQLELNKQVEMTEKRIVNIADAQKNAALQSENIKKAVITGGFDAIGQKLLGVDQWNRIPDQFKSQITDKIINNITGVGSISIGIIAAVGYAIVEWSERVKAAADKRLLQEYQIAAAYNQQFFAIKQMNAELENTLQLLDQQHAFQKQIEQLTKQNDEAGLRSIENQAKLRAQFAAQELGGAQLLLENRKRLLENKQQEVSGQSLSDQAFILGPLKGGVTEAEQAVDLAQKQYDELVDQAKKAHSAILDLTDKSGEARIKIEDKYAKLSKTARENDLKAEQKRLEEIRKLRLAEIDRAAEIQKAMMGLSQAQFNALQAGQTDFQRMMGGVGLARTQGGFATADIENQLDAVAKQLAVENLEQEKKAELLQRQRILQIDLAKQQIQNSAAEKQAIFDVQKRIEDLGKSWQDNLRGVLINATDNPFVKIYSDAEVALQRFREQMKDVPAEIREQGEAALEVARKFDEFKARVEAASKAREYRDAAFDIRNPFLSDRQKQQIQLGRLDQVIDDARGIRTYRNDGLPDPNNPLGPTSFYAQRDPREQEVYDQQLIARSRNIDPRMLRADQREEVAQAYERQAKREESKQDESRKQLKSIDDNVDKIKEHIEQLGKTAANAGRNQVDINIKDGTANGVEVSQPTPADTANYYGRSLATSGIGGLSNR